MAQVIPNLGAFGGVGAGIAQGLENIASRKIADMHEADQRKNRAELFRKAGYDEPTSNVLALFDKKDLVSALQLELQQRSDKNKTEAQGQGKSPIDILKSQQGQQDSLAPSQGKNLQAQPEQQEFYQQQEPQQVSPQQQRVDLSKLSGQQLLQQAQAAGLGLSPEMLQQAAERFERLKQNPEKLQRFQDQLQQEADRQQGQAQPQVPQALQQNVQQQQGQQPNTFALFKKPLTTSEKVALENLEINKRDEPRKAREDIRRERKLSLAEAEQEAKNFDRVQPFLKVHGEQWHTARKLWKEADDLEKIILKHKDKFPTWGGYLPDEAHRDPDIRTYARKATEILNTEIDRMGNNATNYTAGLKAKGKIDLSQPIATQLEAIRSIKRSSQDVFDNQNYIEDIQKKYKDHYPLNISQELISRIGRPDKVKEYEPGYVFKKGETAKEGSILQKDGKLYKKINGRRVLIDQIIS